MNDHCVCLFAYGTLRRNYSHPMAKFLADHARWLGTAKTRGRLYDLGFYPGMRPAEREDEWVFGDLFELNNAEALLDKFDHYEGCAPNDPKPWPFKRELAPVQTENGTVKTAWVYFYTGDMAKVQIITSGDYLQR